MLLIISEQQEISFEKIKSSMSPKTFAKEYVAHNRIRYVICCSMQLNAIST